MITDKMKRKIALFLKDQVTKANMGTGGNASFPNSNDLDVPILTTLVSTVNSESDDTTIDFRATFTGSSLLGNTIREIGLFSDTMPADDKFDELRGGSSIGTVDTTMLTRINFDPIGPFSASDEIEFIFTIEVE
jgi:hypothetical protein